ncbi:uncharacterized protein [Eurosta solidaginis]|uniref:uncharacterized protein isoform X2 n=1 Tax=Eurosta solidaginis TaxID=178769 RepID=UPI0035312A31
MICKKDVIQWFKELESYKRIDTMCTLLNMCLPFELRFLGTCLEELGRRDSQELRGMELRVNNPQDLAADIAACQKGEPTDKKIRRKMALYLALIRACNRTCVTEIFRTLEGWGDRDFQSMNDSDTLQELLLVYTMAANHPVFSFDQQCKCTQIFEKIKENKLVVDADFQTQPPPLQQQMNVDQTFVNPQLQDQRQHLPPSHQELPQHLLHAMHIPGQPHPQILAPVNIMPHIPMTFPQGLHKIIQADGTMQHPVPVDPHLISLNVIPNDTSPIFQPTWQRMYPQTIEGVISSDVAGNPLQTLIRNGYPRRHKTGTTYTPLIHQQQQLTVNPHFQPVTNYSTLAYTMQNMSMSDGSITGLDTTFIPSSMNSNKSAGSDTGSSNASCGDVSPPETPTLSSVSSGLRLGGSDNLHQKHFGYNTKPTGSTSRLNGRPDKLISSNVVVNAVSTTASGGMYTSPLPNTHPALTQQTQPMYGTEIILAPGGNAGGIGLMQTTSLANNNNSGGVGGNNIAVVTSNMGTSNNNIANNPVLMSSPTAGGAGGSILTNITPNSVILPSPHQQYNTTYPYHAAPTTHQRLMNHTGGPAPPPLRLMPNEHIYSYYPIPGAAPPGAPPPVTLRATNSVPPNTNVTSGVTGVLQVQQPTAAQALQTNSAVVPSPTLLTGTPYSTLTTTTLVSNKNLSCYNCGSSSHSGPECQEASMEDVTRSAIYKLDYSGSSSASPTVSTGANSLTVGSVGGGVVITDSLQISHHPHQKQHTVEVTGSSLVSSATTLHSSTPAVSAVVNTK